MQPKEQRSHLNRTESAPAPMAHKHDMITPSHPEGNFELKENREANQEQKEKKNIVSEAIEGITKRIFKPKKNKQKAIPQMRDEVTVKIERIMEEGLKDVFLELTPIQKQEFKIKGEETAHEIRKLMQDKKVNLKKIFKLLFNWLKYLPGVNKFFLEQEAKIKADKIIATQKHYFPYK